MFQTRPIFTSLALGALSLALPVAMADGHGAHSHHHAHAATAGTDIMGDDGRPVGTLRMADGPHGLIIRVEIGAGGLSPGWHGLHLHQTADCSDPGSYTRSGGHVGKKPGGHGLMNPDGIEAGDLPNIWAAADGSAGYETVTAQTSVTDLKDADGSALIIHAGRDDHISQPIGNAGARVACAAIR
jgi:Cu-Zn family superoxide dismutase